jgi:hypothetical protein
LNDTKAQAAKVNMVIGSDQNNNCASKESVKKVKRQPTE